MRPFPSCVLLSHHKVAIDTTLSVRLSSQVGKNLSSPGNANAAAALTTPPWPSEEQGVSGIWISTFRARMGGSAPFGRDASEGEGIVSWPGERHSRCGATLIERAPFFLFSLKRDQLCKCMIKRERCSGRGGEMKWWSSCLPEQRPTKALRSASAFVNEDPPCRYIRQGTLLARHTGSGDRGPGSGKGCRRIGSRGERLW